MMACNANGNENEGWTVYICKPAHENTCKEEINNTKGEKAALIRSCPINIGHPPVAKLL